MNNKIKVSPSILSADFADFKKAANDLYEWNADYIHCDVMDGVFVPNITFGMGTIKAIKKHAKLPLDIHLMIVEPEKYIPQFIDCGANIITFHADASKKVRETLMYIQSKGVKSGLVVNPDVDINSVFPFIDLCDIIVMMGVYPGFGAQKYIPTVTEKIKALRKYIEEKKLSVQIEFDGGITLENAAEILGGGVDITVAGNVVFTSENPMDTIYKLQNYNKL